ncbi:MAG: hypothetical protein WAM42_24740 [Candidatus Nitrosopolaris sp.]
MASSFLSAHSAGAPGIRNAANPIMSHYGDTIHLIHIIPSAADLEHRAHTAYDNGAYNQTISLLKQALQLDPNQKNPIILTNLGAAENVIS